MLSVHRTDVVVQSGHGMEDEFRRSFGVLRDTVDEKFVERFRALDEMCVEYVAHGVPVVVGDFVGALFDLFQCHLKLHRFNFSSCYVLVSVVTFISFSRLGHILLNSLIASSLYWVICFSSSADTSTSTSSAAFKAKTNHY